MSAGLPPFGSAAPPADPHAVARAVLADPRFTVRVAGPLHRTWFDLVRQWIGDRWNDLMHLLFHNVHIGRAASVDLGTVLLGALIVLVVIVLVRLLLSTVRVGNAPQARETSTSTAQARTLHAASMAAAARGDYALAIVLLFQSALAALDLQGVARDERSRTVNEWRRAVRERVPALLPPFDALARPFTAALYADEPVTEAQWRAAHDAYSALRSADA